MDATPDNTSNTRQHKKRLYAPDLSPQAKAMLDTRFPRFIMDTLPPSDG